MVANRLKKGMFPSDQNTPYGLFGLHAMRKCIDVDIFAQNCGWYNADGEQLGWGDLSKHDLYRIAEELNYGEVFVVLCEEAAFRDQKHGCDVRSRGRSYMVKECTLVIIKDQIYYISDKLFEGLEIKIAGGAVAGVMSRKNVSKLLTS